MGAFPRPWSLFPSFESERRFDEAEVFRWAKVEYMTRCVLRFAILTVLSAGETINELIYMYPVELSVILGKQQVLR